jgi:hypothetical protein
MLKLAVVRQTIAIQLDCLVNIQSYVKRLVVPCLTFCVLQIENAISPQYGACPNQTSYYELQQIQKTSTEQTVFLRPHPNYVHVSTKLLIRNYRKPGHSYLFLVKRCEVTNVRGMSHNTTTRGSS